MNFEERTLDLTGFHRANFAGSVRIRHIADWAHDYWKNGFKLVRIKLHDYEYHELMNEIREDNRYLKATPSNLLSIDLGFGEIEIINVDNKKHQ